MSREYEKISTPTAFPAMCVCGSQKGPLVDTGLLKDAYGHVYLCRMCVTRSARALGLIKGAEHERLMAAGDELEQAAREVETRQEIIDRQTVTLGQNEERLRAQTAYIDQLQGDLRLRQQQANQIAAQAREMAAA